MTSAAGGPSVSTGHARLLLAGAGMTYLLVTMGGVVCATGSGLGCPDWPGCYGQVLPPLERGAVIESTHRLLAAATAPLLIAGSVVAWRHYRSVRWLSRPPAVAVALVLAVIVFGAFAVLTGLPPAVAAVDVGSALMVLALMTTAAVVAWLRRDNPALPDRLSVRDSFAGLAVSAVAAVFLVLVTGVFAAKPGSIVRCLGWPLLAAPPGADAHAGVQLARIALAGVAGLLIVALAVRVRQPDHRPPAARPVAAVAFVLFLAEASLGVFMAAAGFTLPLLAVYVALAAGVWVAVVALAVLAAIPVSTKS